MYNLLRKLFNKAVDKIVESLTPMNNQWIKEHQ